MKTCVNPQWNWKGFHGVAPVQVMFFMLILNGIESFMPNNEEFLEFEPC